MFTNFATRWSFFQEKNPGAARAIHIAARKVCENHAGAEDSIGSEEFKNLFELVKKYSEELAVPEEVRETDILKLATLAVFNDMFSSEKR